MKIVKEKKDVERLYNIILLNSLEVVINTFRNFNRISISGEKVKVLIYL